MQPHRLMFPLHTYTYTRIASSAPNPNSVVSAVNPRQTTTKATNGHYTILNTDTINFLKNPEAKRP